MIEEIEARLSHIWCYDIYNDYIKNRLWTGEKAIHVALGMRLRLWMDSIPNLRIWVEVKREYRQSDKQIDLVIIMLMENYEEDRIYDFMTDIPCKDLLRCEIKYEKPSVVDDDLRFLDYSMDQNEDIRHYFAWIPRTNSLKVILEKKQEIIEKTRTSRLRFLYGHPTKPFQWCVYANGKMVYSN